MSNKPPERVLLTTSAAPAQSPFSTTEKRPPVGIGFLISVLRNAGHEVFFIDNYLQPNSFLETDYLQKHRIDYVGIYANTICFRDTLRMIHKLERLRQMRQWAGRIIVGGPHTTVAPHTIPDYVDYVVQGEGEHAIVDIVNGKVTQRIVSYPRIENLDTLPMPAWDCFADLPYDWGIKFFQDKPVFTMNTSRGCPFGCTFCSVGSIWGKKYTYFSAERIVSDIEYLVEHYGAKGIYFREDNFTLNKQRLTRFCNLLIEKGIKIPWVCESRVSNLTRELVELMARAGAKGFYLGVESGSQRILDFLHKDITVEQIKNTFKWCSEFNIKTAASIIIGVPCETEADRRQTSELLKLIKPTVTWPNIFVGIPDSILYRHALKNRLYEFIDDRGLVYLQGHNQRVRRFYGKEFGRKASIPNSQNNIDTANKPKISVLLCVHNGERFVRQALESIYQQTFQDFEVIVVDDGSTDGTPDILQQMKDARTCIYRNESNLGLTKSLNIGFGFCRGDYIARMDADDVSHPRRFAKQLKFLEENPSCLAVGSWVGWIDEQANQTGTWNPPVNPDEINERLLSRNAIAHGSAVIRKSALLSAGGYNTEYPYAQDYDLWLRLSEQGELRNIGEVLYYLRNWSGAVSTSKKQMQRQFAEKALQQACKRRGIPCVTTADEKLINRETSRYSESKEITEDNIPKISVVLTAYNRPQLLAEVLAGFADQTVPAEDFEVIVVDDGSDQPVKEIVEKFRSRINIVCLRQQNSGLAAARNNGIKAAKGQIVLFSDDDDVPSAELIAEHLRSHRENPDERIAVLGHLDWHQRLQVTPLMHYVTGPGGEYFGYDKMQDGRLYNVWKWWGGLISAKLSLLKSLEGPFDSRLRFGYEDTELACRLLHRDIKVLYNAKAKSFIIRPVDFESFCRRRYMQGRALYYAACMHPEIIIPRYNLQNAANLYRSRYEPFLDEWSGKVIKFEPLLNNQSHLQDPEYDRHLESLYTVYRQCFIGYWLKGYVEQMQAVRSGRVSLSEPVNARPAEPGDNTEPDCNQPGAPCIAEPLRITFLNSCTPGFDRGSSNLRIYHILKILADGGHKIDHLYFSQNKDDQRYKSAFAGSVNFISMPADVKSILDYFQRSKDISKMDCLWITNLWSVDYLNFALHLTRWMSLNQPQTKVIIDTMDFHYKKFMRKFNVSHNDQDLLQARRFLEVEKELYPLADEVLTVTEQDRRDILENIGSRPNVSVIPNIHKIPAQTTPLQQRKHICFIGALHTSHNADAVKWFLKEVFPFIIEKAPDVEFHVLGFGNESFRSVLEVNANVKVIGYVEDAEAAIADYRLFVCPMTYGAGMKGKIGVAVAAATPVVTTNIGAEGFGFTNGQNCFIADDPQEFAWMALRLLSETALWEEFSTKAKKMLADKFSIRTVSEKINALLQNVTTVEDLDKTAAHSLEIPAPSSCADSTCKSTPKVSIITSCYNSEKFLHQCLDSIRKQTMPEWELFLLDDASTDGTRKIIEKYSRMDERIKPYYFQDNKGPYVRRNFAIEQANSDFIVIQDADDIMREDKLKILYNEIIQDNRLGIVGSFYRVFLDEFNGLEHTDEIKLLTEHSRIVDKQSSWQNSISHGSAIIRKELFDTIGPYDENPFGSDTFWLVKVAEYAKHCTDVKFKNITQCLTLVRMYPDSQTGLLPLFDPRGRRVKYRCYCECKLKRIRHRLGNLPLTDIKTELKNCVCSDFLEKFSDFITQWESEPLDDNILVRLVDSSASLFNERFYVLFITGLSGLEKIAPNIAKKFKNYDLLRAMAYFAIDRKQQCLEYLNREIQNHNSPAAKRFISDYFEKPHFAEGSQNENPENQPNVDIQNWYLENSKVYDLWMIDTDSESRTGQKSGAVSGYCAG